MIVARAARRLSILALSTTGLLAANPAGAQTCVSLTTIGAAVAQNFDSLASSGTSSTLPTGWYLSEAGTNANTTYSAGTGSSNAGDTYSFGATATAERAFGGLQSGTLIPTIGACFTNNTGQVIASVAIAYTGEEWRLGAGTATDRIDFQSSVNATSLTTGTWSDTNALDFSTPNASGSPNGARDGNLAANRTAISAAVTGLSIANGANFWIRWTDLNVSGTDDGLAVDDFSLTPSAAPPVVTLSINDATVTEGNSGTTIAQLTVSLTLPAGAGGVTFDIATQDNTATTADNDYVARTLLGQSIAAGSQTYLFDVTVNGDLAVEANETFFVNVTNVVGATAGDTQGTGTINNDDLPLTFIHDVQGPGASSPMVGSTVAVEGVVIGDFQITGSGQLAGFFLQEEDADADANPLTSEGIFVFCSACPTPVAEGQRVRATGAVSEFFGLTEITASSAGSLVVTEAGNHLAEVAPSPIDLPVPTLDIDDFYEPLESMRVTFVDSLTVSEYFELARYGQVELFAEGRPQQFTQGAAPSVSGYAAHLDALDHRRVLLDDDDNAQNAYLPLADGFEAVFHPTANGGFSIGLQGTDFFRGGDLVNGLTGVLHWSFAGLAGTDAWRVRPTAATPAVFTVANPRPPAPPAVGGSIRAASVNLLNYFTTLDTGVPACGPLGDQDCRGANSAAERVRQRERAALVLCGLDADVVGLTELENSSATGALADLVAAVNASCGGADPYAYVSTGGTLGSDAIRVGLIYRSLTLTPFGAPLVDLDPVHNRPPTAQTFTVADPANPAFGQRFTVVANHLKSKGCGGAAGGDLDQLDGQSCYVATRVAQANRLLVWLAGTVVPAAGDPDLLLLGDYNSYAFETPIVTLAGGGLSDLLTVLLGNGAYSYLFDGQLGRLDYALASAGLLAETTGVAVWHINADEVPLLDYNDTVVDPGEASFDKKPDGASLAPPRVVFEPATPYRAADHDPVLVGLYRIADLSVTKSDAPDPVAAGANLTYTITVANAGPDSADAVAWSDALEAGLTFVSLAQPGGWTCSTPPVGSMGTVSCSRPTFAPGSAVFTLVVEVGAHLPAGTVLPNSASVVSATGDPDAANDSDSETTTVISVADLSVVKAATVSPATAGLDLAYTLTVANGGPSWASNVTLTDPLPAGTTFVSVSPAAGWTCATPPPGSGGVVSCTTPSFFAGPLLFTLTVHVDSVVPAGTLLVNSASIASASGDPDPADNLSTVQTPVIAPALVSATKSVDGEFAPGGSVVYTLVLSNAGPADQPDAAGDELIDALPAGLQLVSATASAGTAAADLGTNVVTWNGVIPAGGSVTVTIEATIPLDVEHGTIYANQGIVAFDGDGDGVNESSAVTDDPATGEADDPTEFQVLLEVLEIPALGDAGRLLLALLLAGLAARRLGAARVRAAR